MALQHRGRPAAVVIPIMTNRELRAVDHPGKRARVHGPEFGDGPTNLDQCRMLLRL